MNKKDYFVDLHVHTKASDGALDLFEVVQPAKEIGLSYIALTDHDNAGYSAESIRRYNEHSPGFLVKEERAILRSGPLRIIQGIELTTRFGISSERHGGYSMHIVGLFTEYPPKDLEARFDKIKDSRLARLLEMAEKINAKETKNPKGEIIRIPTEEVTELVGEGVASRLHLGYLLYEKGIGKSPMHARDLYLSEGAESYVRFSEEIMPTDEGIEIIHKQLKGLCFVAHPNVLHKSLEPWETIKILRQMGVDGLEYSSHMAYNDAGLEHKMLFSSGSDYHGERFKPDVRLGRDVSSEEFERLLEEKDRYL